MRPQAARRLAFADSLWVAGALVAAMAPLLPRLPWWVAALAGTVGAWHLYAARLRLPAPRRWITGLLALGIAAAVYLQFRTLFGRDAGIALLIGMLALKLLETRTARDGVLLLALAFFLVLTHFLFSQSIASAIYLFACVWTVTAGMVRLQHPAARPVFALRTAGTLLVQSLPLMLIVFLFFPRVQGPLWGTPADAYTGLSGLSDTMTPGSVSRLILSDNVAFRARFEGPLPARDHLYWRGPVLTQFDGRAWTAAWARVQRAPAFDSTVPAVEYEVTLEAHNKRWLFALDLPARVPAQAAATVDYQLLAREPVTTRRRYAMASHLDYLAGVDDGAAALKPLLHLPPGSNPRTADFARNLRARHASDDAYIAAVLARFRNEQFVYTLEPPPLNDHPVDAFLFETRAGFCEHSASAFTVLMRAAGIPARVVTGYLGGDVNPVGDYLIVRQADAHAWSEVWLRERGWVRVDPTAAVSPLRVERGVAAAVEGEAPLPLLVRTDFALLREVAHRWDALAHTWNLWVLGYTAERQRIMVEKLGVEASWRTLGIALAVTGALALTITALVMLTPRRRRRRDEVQRLYLDWCARLARRGLPRAPHEGPHDYARRIARWRPELAAAAGKVVEVYAELRYAARGANTDVATLKAAIRRMRGAL